MRRLPAYLRPLWLVLLVALGCDSGSGPSAGNLTITVIGVPTGSSAAITVTGPAGFSQPVTATQTFTQVTPGSYAIAASSITAGGSEYAPSPPNQNITVNGSANAMVRYGLATGNLAITINGIGTASSAAVTVTGPNSYTQAVTASTTILGLTPGSYTVTARDTTATGGTSETASPNTQSVSVLARQTASATVTYTPPPNGGSVNLSIAGMYLTQSAQNYAGSVPLVKGRNGYLRVFVVANNANAAAPAVRVRFFNGGVLPFDSTLILSPGLATPTVVDESSLSYSWNFSVPGSWIQPGLAVSAEVDPANAVIETVENDNVFPSTGTALMDVRVVPALDVVFVPILQKGIPLSRRKGNVTTANQDQFLQTTQRMHPIETYTATVHSDYTTITTDTLQADNGNGAWGRILGELDVVRVAEHSPKYYYGVAKVTYTSGVAGVAFVSVPGTTPGSGARTALGWDWLPSGGTVAAHELGHNWGRNHAPCGGPAGLDPQYPQSNGSTGSYGVDIGGTPTLHPATDSDIMGYCNNKWISDYTYKGVLNYLLNPSTPQTSVASQSVQPSLLVWGHIRNGEIVLEPAFWVNTRPSLPARPGPYALEARNDDGSTAFVLSFAPNEVADAGGSQQNFTFAIPMPAGRAARLSSLRVTGGGHEALTLASSAGVGDSVTVRRIGGNHVALRWNATAQPMVMVRDVVTGQVLSLARGGDVELTTTKSQLDLIFSNGVRSHLKRVQVTR
ncbi:MAG TPA: hypothetical protein VGN76_04085 [Gemmatimonadales bacterium]|jgi:hypothetical protein|nr:hypothetical protein [Gemmatimonadales bacterium]